MDENTLKQRTKQLALDLVKIVDPLPNRRSINVISHQLLRCGMGTGANYRAACRAKSDADMLAKLGIVEEEADEVQYWLEILQDQNCAPENEVRRLHRESGEIVAIMVASRKTLRKRIDRDGNSPR